VTSNHTRRPEPWLRGTLTDVPPVARGVLHALELAREDLHRWCDGLSVGQIHARPGGLPSVAFQLRHIGGSVDRLLTYAEGGTLSEAQFAGLTQESATHEEMAEELLKDVDVALERACERVRALATLDYSLRREVGRQKLPTTLGGLLVHVAEHTQRHAGQAVTTAKLISGSNSF